MLNITTIRPLSWSIPSTSPVAPVEAVPATGSAPTASRDGQRDPGRKDRSDSQARAGPDLARISDTGPSLPPAPLLPAGTSDLDPLSPAGQVLGAKRGTEKARNEERQAQDKAEQRPALQEVLTTVWKASAAVVDVVLGKDTPKIDTDSSIEGASRVDEASDLSQRFGVKDSDLETWLRREPQPEAYTEQGEGSWSPKEAGSLLSTRV